MPGNSFGQAFRITTAGESHGPGYVVIIDGVPPGLELSVDELMVDMNRRRPGQSQIVTQRDEADVPEILSGIFEGRTTGTSLAILVRNNDQRSRDYDDIQHVYRPGHADYTYDAKYGFRDYRGGGRSSARETTVRVAAGVVAKKLIANAFGGRSRRLRQTGGRHRRRRSRSRGGHPRTSRKAPRRPAEYRPLPRSRRPPRKWSISSKNCEARGTRSADRPKLSRPEFRPAWGSRSSTRSKPTWQKPCSVCPPSWGLSTESVSAASACAAVRTTTCFDRAKESTSSGKPGVTTDTNRHGGMLGGITSGRPLVLRAAVKPTSSLPIEQETVTDKGEPTTIRTKGRHDPCLLPRFVPMAEAMVAIVLADHWLRWKAQCQ